MAPANRIAALAAELDAALPVLDRINRFYDQFHQQTAARQSTENAIIVSDVFVSFYTCLETPFLRISQFFENALDDSRWHEQLLRAMTRTIRPSGSGSSPTRATPRSPSCAGSAISSATTLRSTTTGSGWSWFGPSTWPAARRFVPSSRRTRHTFSDLPTRRARLECSNAADRRSAGSVHRPDSATSLMCPEPARIAVQRQWALEHRGAGPVSDSAGPTASRAGETT